jgi:hypothetical protein
MKPSVSRLAMATMGITMLLLPTTAAATFKATAAAQGTARKLRVADSAADVMVTATRADTRRLQQLELDWHQPGQKYGAWCCTPVVDCPARTSTPIDALDHCCMLHNKCYGNATHMSAECQCDRDMIKCLSAVDTSASLVDQLQVNLAKVTGIEYYTNMTHCTCF